MGYLFRFSFSFLSSAASYIPIHHDAGQILIINFFKNDKCWEENTKKVTRPEKYIYNKFPLFCRKVTILHSLFFVGLPSVWQSFGPLPSLQPTLCCAASNFKYFLQPLYMQNQFNKHTVTIVHTVCHRKNTVFKLEFPRMYYRKHSA